MSNLNQSYKALFVFSLCSKSEHWFNQENKQVTWIAGLLDFILSWVRSVIVHFCSQQILLAAVLEVPLVHSAHNIANVLINMDATKCKALADLCDALTTSGEPQLDQKKVKEIKKICRYRITNNRFRHYKQVILQSLLVVPCSFPIHQACLYASMMCITHERRP